jgi:predicted DNA-binding ribbon-helix-helix protein
MSFRTTLLEINQEQVQETVQRSSLLSKNITVRGHRTSIRLEPEMWNAIKDIALREGTSIHSICSLISIRKAADTSLTAAIRVFLMLYYRAATTQEGHLRAGHGNFENMKRRARVTDEILIGKPAN